MIRLQINPAFTDLLRSCNLHSYSRIMQTSDGEIIEDNDERDVRRLSLDGTKVYLKRTRFERLSPALESYCHIRMAHSKTFREMIQLHSLEELGFDVAEVVAVGEKLRLAIPREGFLITREVPGQDLARIYHSANKVDRNHIMGHFGSLLGRLHDHGFFGSTRLKDVISRGDPGGSFKLTLIDRETRNPYPKRVDRKTAINRLLFNIRRQAQQGEVFSNDEWATFAEHYCRAVAGHYRIAADVLHNAIVAKLSKSKKNYLPE